MAFLDDVLTWIESAIVFVATVADAIVQAIVAFGSWVADLTSGDPVRVANAVRAAENALQQAFDWVLRFVEDRLRPLTQPILDLMALWLSSVEDAFRELFAPNPVTVRDLSTASNRFGDRILEHGFVTLLLGFGIAVQVLEGVLIALQFALPGGAAIGLVVRGILASAAKTALERWVVASIVAFSVGAILGFVLPETHVAWDIPLTALGVSLAAFAVFFSQMIWVKFTKGKWVAPGVGDIIGFVLSIVGFILAWQLPSIGVTPEIVSILGALFALVGLGISIYSESPIDTVGGPVVGRIDEIANAGFLGFAVGAAVKENAT